MKTAQLAVKEHGIIDRDGLLLKAEARFAELITIEADEGAQRKDIHSLKRWVYLGTCVSISMLKLVSIPLDTIRSVHFCLPI